MILIEFPEVPDFIKPLVSHEGSYPKVQIDGVIERREEAIPHLLGSIEWMLKNPLIAMDADRYTLPFFSLFLLAQFREKRAEKLIVSLCRHPMTDELLGDIITGGMHSILASVCMDNPNAIKSIVEDPDAEEFARAAAIEALAILTLNDKLPRESLSKYLTELYDFRLEKEPSYVWDGAVAVSTDLGFSEHLELIKEAYMDGLADETVDNLKDVVAILEKRNLRDHDPRRYRFVDNIDSAISHWYCFTDNYLAERKKESENSAVPDIEVETENLAPDPGRHTIGGFHVETYRRPEPKVGRNDPCPCGSGKKYKKCCGA